MDFKHRMQVGTESRELYFKQFVAVTDYQALYLIFGLESPVTMVPGRLGDWEIVGFLTPQLTQLQEMLSRVIIDKLAKG